MLQLVANCQRQSSAGKYSFSDVLSNNGWATE